MIDKERLLKQFEKAIDKAIELRKDERIIEIIKGYDIKDEVEREKCLADKINKIYNTISFNDSVSSLALMIALSDGNILNDVI